MTSQLPDAAMLNQALVDGGLWRAIRVVDSTGSTNLDVAQWARDGVSPGLVLIANEQTAGRGRRTRTWASPYGASISMSMLLAPRPGFERWGWLSLLTGLAVADALESLAPAPEIVELKWPNDVLIRGRKVCGILSEHVPTPDGSRAVVGLGINVSLAQDQLPVPTATSLLLEGFTTDSNQVLIPVLQRFAHYFEQWQTTADLAEDYTRRCASIGRKLTVVADENNSIDGVGHGVDEWGRLQVISGSQLRTFAVGDVIHARLNA